MRIRLYHIVLLVFLGISCQDDKKTRETEQLKDQKKRELVFEEINKAWNLNSKPLSANAQAAVSRWEEWRIFKNELRQKPKSSIGAFQQKSRALAQRALELNNNIPFKLNKPSVKSRMAVLLTQIRSLDLYIHLHNIPAKKVISLIPEINYGVASLQSEFDEIIRKGQIPMEQGESDIIRMRDTARAIPTIRNSKLIQPINFEQVSPNK